MIVFPRDSIYYKDVYYFAKHKQEVLKVVKEQKDFVKHMGKKLRDALEKYTHWFDSTINFSLRKGRVSKMTNDLITSIVNAIEIVDPMPPFIAYRGISNEWTKMEVGSFFSDKGISSKSLSVIDALDFTGDFCCLMIMAYPHPSQHIFVQPFSHYQEERELITFPSEVFRVEDIGYCELDDGIWIKAFYCKFVELGFSQPIVDPYIDEMFTNQVLPLVKKYPTSVIVFVDSKSYYENVNFADKELELPQTSSININNMKAKFHSLSYDEIMIVDTKMFLKLREYARNLLLPTEFEYSVESGGIETFIADGNTWDYESRELYQNFLNGNLVEVVVSNKSFLFEDYVTEIEFDFS
jgi:uncharacterized protein (DUF3820 family)